MFVLVFYVLNGCSHQQVACAEMTQSDWDCKMTENSLHVCLANCHSIITVLNPKYSSEYYGDFLDDSFLLTAMMFNVKCQMFRVCDIESQ